MFTFCVDLYMYQRDCLEIDQIKKKFKSGVNKVSRVAVTYIFVPDHKKQLFIILSFKLKVITQRNKYINKIKNVLINI